MSEEMIIILKILDLKSGFVDKKEEYVIDTIKNSETYKLIFKKAKRMDSSIGPYILDLLVYDYARIIKEIFEEKNGDIIREPRERIIEYFKKYWKRIGKYYLTNKMIKEFKIR